MKVHKTIKSLYLIFIMVLIGFLQSCYYDVEQELYPNPCNTENIKYSSDVVNLLTSYQCISCHNSNTGPPQGGVNLSDYQSVKTHVDNGWLLGAIKHQSGFQPMPQSAPKMAACDIAKIEAWITEGAINN